MKGGRKERGGGWGKLSLLQRVYKASQRGPIAGRAVGRDGKAARGEQAGGEVSLSLLPSASLSTA